MIKLKFMKIIFMSLLILSLFSCMTMQTINIKPENIETLFPQLNQLSESEVGESLIHKETGEMYQAIKLIELIKCKAQSYSKPVELKPGEIFFHTKQTKLFDIYSQEGSIWGIVINRKNHVAELASDIYLVGKYSLLGKVIDSSKYINILQPLPKSNYLKQEFIYNGKIGTGLKFTYREFASDMARPSFTQDLQYDLSEGNIVGFKGLRIEIIKAQNTKIEYKILSFFRK